MTHKTYPSSENVVAEDLDSICTSLTDEFGAMAGCRLLITGGAGFLGYYLVQSVLHWNKRASGRNRINLVLFDNFVRGRPSWLESIEGDPNLEVREVDLCQPLPRDIGHFDYIIHAAGIASPIYYRAFPLKCIDANIVGLRNLLEYSSAEIDAKRPLAGLLFYSSSEIYGDPTADAIPTPETYRGNVSCTGPRACYDESKRFGETLCVTFARQFGVPVKMARPFNNYGPGLKITDGRVIPDFARDILAGRDIVMLSDGSPTRTFCYATDAIVGYYKALVRGRAGEPYNVGIDRPEISVGDLAALMVDHARDLFGYRGRVVLGSAKESDYLTDNPNRRCPDISKGRSELGYAPSVMISDGILRSLIWYSANSSGTAA